MAQFLETYGFELILVLYSILSSIVNVLTFRRTGTTNKIIRGSDIPDVPVPDKKTEKTIKKIEKARTKLEKLLFDNNMISDGEVVSFYDDPEDGV